MFKSEDMLSWCWRWSDGRPPSHSLQPGPHYMEAPGGLQALEGRKKSQWGAWGRRAVKGAL